MKHVKVINSKKNLRRFKRKYPIAQKYCLDTIKQITDKLLGDMSDILIGQPNGIVLDKIGYFSIVEIEEDRVFYPLNDGKNFYLKDEDEHIEFLYFFPQIFKYSFLRMYICKASPTFKNKLKKIKDKEGNKYLNHFSLLYNINHNGQQYFDRTNSR